MMRRFVYIAILILATFSGSHAFSAQENLKGPVSATLLKVVDGDTVLVRAHIWLHQHIDISVRLRGIDAPELKSKCPAHRQKAEKARGRLQELLHTQNNDETLTLRHISTGKYANRVIAYVDNQQGRSVGDILLKEKLAVPYHKRKSARHCF